MRLYCLDTVDLVAIVDDGRAVLWCNGAWHPANGSHELAREVLRDALLVEVEGEAAFTLRKWRASRPALPMATIPIGRSAHRTDRVRRRA